MSGRGKGFWRRGWFRWLAGQPDPVDRTHLLISAIFTGGAGGVLGAAAGLLAAEPSGFSVVLFAGSGFLLGGAFPFLRSVVVSGLLWGLVARWFEPAGGFSLTRRRFSHPESLAARGRHHEALQVYQEMIRDQPGDPEPYFRVARILQDEMGRLEEAARWLRRTRKEVELSPDQEVLLARKLVDLYRFKLGAPARALPELARMAEVHAGTPDGEWAAREARRIRRTLGASSD